MTADAGIRGWRVGRRGWRLGLACLLALMLLTPGLSPSKTASGASTVSSKLFTLQGSTADLTNGDYLSSSQTANGLTGLGSHASFFIEVPPGLSELKIEIFDPDVGAGGPAEVAAGRDRSRSGTAQIGNDFDTSVMYSLIRPDGSTASLILPGGGTGPSLTCDWDTCTDNVWQTILDGTTTQNTMAGHWELRVAMGTGDDINAFGVRASDGNTNGTGTELPIYVDSLIGIGVNPPASGTDTRSYTLYPYITSGCQASENDFDFDSNNGNVGSITLTSPNGTFGQSFSASTLSGDAAWKRNVFSGWTLDSDSNGYGIWNAAIDVSSYLSAGAPNGNYTTLYFGNYQAAANPPSQAIPANNIPIYLPTDAGTAPVKPYVTQYVRYDSGPNPPAVGATSRFWIFVGVANPTARPITFSSPTNLVTANVPGSGVIYRGHAQVSQGTLVSQPSVGGTGNLTWNPGTVPAGTTVFLQYAVDFTPTSAGQRAVLSGTTGNGNGTRAQYVDETGNTTQARATAPLGPICELAATQGVLSPIGGPFPGPPSGSRLSFNPNPPASPGGITAGVPFTVTV